MGLYKNLSSIVLILIFLPLRSQDKEQGSFLLKGTVISKNDSNTIPYAHIIEILAREGTVCNQNGNFVIHVLPNDTLYFSAIGFNKLKVPASDFVQNNEPFVFIKLEEAIYSMDEVVIVPYKNYKELKEAILAYKPSDENRVDLDLPKFNKKSPISTENGQIKVTFSPISAIYNIFSKEGKQISEYNRLIERQEIDRKIQKKYNIDIVRHITGIENERKILDFMEYCHFPDTFLLTSNDYDIYLAINNCYRSFIIDFPNI